MKRIGLILFLTLATGMVAQAQVALGIKGGISSSHVDVKNVRNTITQFRDKDNITGYHLGAFLRFKTGSLVIQPEGVFSSSGGKVAVTRNQSGTVVETTEEFKFNRLDVPVLVGVSLLNFARIQAGPVASVLMGGELGDQDLDSFMDKTDIGWQAGIGFDIGHVTADVRYERVKREYTNPDNSFDVGNQQLILSLGFKVFGN
jgi:opacity protein-like surface antigen